MVGQHLARRTLLRDWLVEVAEDTVEVEAPCWTFVGGAEE